MLNLKKCISIGALLALSGCAAWSPYGPLFTDSTVAVANHSVTNYQVDKGDYQVLGPAEGMSEYINVLGLIATGDGGYQSAFAKACAAKGADNLIDAKTDVKIWSILGIYTKVNYKVSGTAVKRR